MLIVGAGGFAKEIVQTILDNNPSEEIFFFDNVNTDSKNVFLGKFTILVSHNEVEEYFNKGDKRFVIGVGNPNTRKKIADQFVEYGGELHSIISNNASIGSFENSIGIGTTLLQQVVIENTNQIGTGCLIHVGAFISHDVIIGNYCEISPYVKLLGKVKIGNLVSIGAGAIILPGIEVGDDAVIGAGSVVTKNVSVGDVVVGVPAKSIKK